MANRFQFGNDTAVVAVQHMLLQTVDLFRTAGRMGLDLRNVFALGKVYSNNSHVIRLLRNMGVTVIDTTIPKPGDFNVNFVRDIDTLWRIASEALSRRRIKRVLILDDAGCCISRVPKTILDQYEVCGVEQTSQGMFLFEQESPPCAVISWARSAVKLKIGSPIFSHCFVDRFSSRFLRLQPAHRQFFGVIGLGSIGRGVANLFARQGLRVLFYDPDPDLSISSFLRERTTRAGSLEELMVHCDYVVGCSGRNPFRDKWPIAHKSGITLLSASGGDQEVGPVINQLKQQPDFRIDPDTCDMTCEHGPSGPIRIAYLGYPYTFVSRGLEAVPSEIVQLETGGLLAALIQAAIYLDLCEERGEQSKGIHRVVPSAQKFVYEHWLQAMKARQISFTEIFGYDPERLDAAPEDCWFVRNTEPAEANDTIEDKMNELIYCEREMRVLAEP